MKKTILSVALATAVSSTLPVFADAAEPKTSAPVSTTLQQTVLNKAAEGKTSTTAGNVNINFDVLGIANALINAANANTNREGFVKGLMESAFYAAGAKYNVMVFNLSQGYETRFNGVKTFATVKYGSITYGVWVFENGSFTNKGDGGYINWAFRGWFDRNGGFVNFRRP
ncbi:stress protein [Bacillus safensis subsp. safensis]|uniref:stress protein n=1 Tax=Bacillus safensis TaxID=561879 RepID=UPI0037C16059